MWFPLLFSSSTSCRTCFITPLFINMFSVNEAEYPHQECWWENSKCMETLHWKLTNTSIWILIWGMLHQPNIPSRKIPPHTTSAARDIIRGVGLGSPRILSLVGFGVGICVGSFIIFLSILCMSCHNLGLSVTWQSIHRRKTNLVGTWHFRSSHFYNNLHFLFITKKVICHVGACHLKAQA